MPELNLLRRYPVAKHPVEGRAAVEAEREAIAEWLVNHDYFDPDGDIATAIRARQEPT